MLHHVADADSSLAEELEEGFYVFDFENIVYKISKGVFLYHNPRVEAGRNIVHVFVELYPEAEYQSVTKLPLHDVIVPLRERIKIMTS